MLALGFLFSCTETRILEIKGGYQNKNALRIELSVKLNKAAEVAIEYWQKDTQDTLVTRQSPKALVHDIIITHMPERTKYNYRVLVNDHGTQIISDVYEFKTGVLPAYMPKFNLVKGNGSVFSGFIMVRKTTEPGAQIILNSQGNIVWYQVLDTALFRPFSLTSDTSYIALKATDEIIEMSIDDDTLCHIKKGTNDFNRDLHHEIYKDSKGHLVALTKEIGTFDMRSYGGTATDSVVGDGILVLDAKGNEIWRWNIFDHMDTIADEVIYKTKKDWSHANAVNEDLDGNYLVSFRNFNQVWKIDRRDGHIIWRLGEQGDFSLDPQGYFKGQHAAHINPRGELMLFDNNAEGKKSSRALAFKINDDHKSARVTLSVNLPDSLYSFKQGSVYFIDNKRLLFCSSMSNKIAITDLDGKILWQLNSAQSFYRAVYLTK